MDEDDRSPIEVAYERRNRNLDPQLVWRGKDDQDQRDLVVQAPPPWDGKTSCGPPILMMRAS